MLPLPVDPACTVVRVRYEGALDPLPFSVHPSADGTLLLLPHDATLEGPSLKVEQVGVIGDVKYNIGYWLDPAASATWPIAGQRAGKYRVVAELACKSESAGARVSLDCGGSRVDFTVEGTGGWQDYREFELGVLDVPVGSQSVSLRAASKPGEAVVNVRAIRLVPVR
jgi:hypothetical protein